MQIAPRQAYPASSPAEVNISLTLDLVFDLDHISIILKVIIASKQGPRQPWESVLYERGSSVPCCGSSLLRSLPGKQSDYVRATISRSLHLYPHSQTILENASRARTITNPPFSFSHHHLTSLPISPYIYLSISLPPVLRSLFPRLSLLPQELSKHAMPEGSPYPPVLSRLISLCVKIDPAVRSKVKKISRISLWFI